MLISVLCWIMACTESDGLHQSLAKLRQKHNEAQERIQQGDIQKGIEELRELNKEYPDSRALLESLLTAELQGEGEGEGDVLQVGYNRVKGAVQSNPGDAVLRLLQAKFHLATGNVALANSDLQVVLFNQQFHPWKLAQDSFLQRYQDVIDASLIPFALLQVLQVDIPNRILLGDPGEMRFAVMHLSDCAVSLSKVDLTVSLSPTRLQIQTERIDDVVKTTTMILSVQTQYPGEQQSVPIQLTCGERSISAKLPSFNIISLTDEPFVSKGGHLYIPSVNTLGNTQSTTGVYWEHYYNQVLVNKGAWSLE